MYTYFDKNNIHEGIEMQGDRYSYKDKCIKSLNFIKISVGMYVLYIQ